MVFTACVARLQQGLGVACGVLSVEVAILECCAPAVGNDTPTTPFTASNVDFFDEELRVCVYRLRDSEGERPFAYCLKGATKQHGRSYEMSGLDFRGSTTFRNCPRSSGNEGREAN